LLQSCRATTPALSAASVSPDGRRSGATHPARGVNAVGALLDGAVKYGAICSLPDGFSAEVLGRCGFDWSCVDMQHGTLSEAGLYPVLQGLAAGGTPALVRVRWNEPAAIMRALDAGASGVIVPMIQNAADAAAAVAACRYPPAGIRSWGPTRARYSMTPYSARAADQSVICAVMIETESALDCLDEIVAVPGVDCIVIGPSDLALSLGASPSLIVDSAQVDDAIGRVLAACAAAGVCPGIFTSGADQAIRWRERGFRLICTHSDRLLMAERAEQLLSDVRTR
jgi:4-hydroxy-2-oxoheptanedioate aldolase